jgi:HEAT repeat protein
MLGDLGDPRAVEPLRRTLRIDPVAEVVAAAEEALRALGAIPSEDDGEPSGPAF